MRNRRPWQYCAGIWIGERYREKEGWNGGKRSAANVNANGRDVGMEGLQPGVDNGSDGYDG